MTSQNLRVAVHVPLANPVVGDVVQVKATGPYETEFGTGGGGAGALPVATKQGQIIESGVGPTFAWQAQDPDLDMGRF